MQNQIVIFTNFLEQLAKIFWFTAPIVGSVLYFFYVLDIRKKIEVKEEEIFKVKKEIDDMLTTTHNKTKGYVNQSQLEAITEKNRIPLRNKLETLKLERQFLLDKISILNLVKK